MKRETSTETQRRRRSRKRNEKISSGEKRRRRRLRRKIWSQNALNSFAVAVENSLAVREIWQTDVRADCCQFMFRAHWTAAVVGRIFQGTCRFVKGSSLTKYDKIHKRALGNPLSLHLFFCKLFHFATNCRQSLPQSSIPSPFWRLLPSGICRRRVLDRASIMLWILGSQKLADGGVSIIDLTWWKESSPLIRC